jgi:single-strand DNA-binding protein
MNRVILIGRLGKDPETRSTQAGKTISKFSLATDSGFGESKKTDWHQVVCFDRSAEIAAEFLAKGRQVAVEGRISYQEWEKPEGGKGYKTEIICDRLEFVGSPAGETKPRAEAPEKPEPLDDGAIPF